ncbi:MAG: hypothetical protein HY589_05280 [Candidatus Omnitrophica bacterium]|nr:hypothetical protein [Candidatus Omnitrophota bacterium]
MNIIKKIFTLLAGVISIPLTITVSKAFYYQLSGMSMFESRNQAYFLYGAASYIIMHLFLFKPNFVYNLGHETVHVLSTWISFGKAKNMRVSGEGGSVQTSKSNFFINISPYFVPIYTVILCLAYFLISKFNDISQYTPVFVFFIGFTLAMHIVMTVDALKISQPDLIRTGYLLSLSSIYVINMVAAAFVISLIFAGFSFSDFFTQFCLETKSLYFDIYRQLFGV